MLPFGIVLVAATGWVFWIPFFAICVFAVLALYAEDDGMGGWTIFLTVAGFAFMWLCTDAFKELSPAQVIVIAFGYMLCGVGWAVKKFIDYVKRQKEYSLENYKSFHKDNETIPAYLARVGAPKVSKVRFTTWAATWPLSFSWWVLTYPRHFFNWAYDLLINWLDEIAQRIWYAQ